MVAMICTQAEAAVGVLGENVVKVAAKMADNAAKDVGDEAFVAKDIAVDLMKAGDENLTEEQLEVMATNFVDACTTHGGGYRLQETFRRHQRRLKQRDNNLQRCGHDPTCCGKASHSAGLESEAAA
jgi:hypothetical protein